jgi:hypothetical protein
MKYLALLICLSFLISNSASAQKDTVWKTKPTVNLSVFADVFYVYDFGRPKTSYRQKFLYNHNRHNEFNLNLGLIKFNVNHSKYRANLALQVGTYVADNYANEPVALKNISEANIGLSLSKRDRVWLDVGILPSHIGFESAISKENLTLTRSLSAENSPYFEAGAKLSFKPNEKLELAAFALNGWQRIQRVSGNSMLSFGTQVGITPNNKLLINWSTFIGTIDPDISRRMRYFSNIYAHWKKSKYFTLIAGFDIGAQQVKKDSSAYNIWLTPTLIGQLKLNSKWKTALRIEYFKDDAGILLPTNPINGTRILGFSMNFDYSPTPNLVCRFEGRWLSGAGYYFTNKNGISQENFILGGSIAFAFMEQLAVSKK